MKTQIKEMLRKNMLEQKDMYESVEIQAPNHLKLKHNYKTIFLAGSIEMGKAEEWQKKIVESVPNKPYIFFNPRRDDWDSSWEQVKTDKDFRQQVEWELEALEVADYIIMYFDPETQSPISLAELGLHARDGKLLVVCPEGFWKKGNVDIMCEFYKIRQIESIDSLIEILKSEELREKKRK